jgi:NAD(P)-dependent dehydrogenase (short-subunit alcohol dehydrogenase family)
MEKMGQINLVAPFAGIIKDAMLVSPDRETGKVTKKMSLEDFQKVIDINLTGVFLTIRECSEQMINHDCKGLICLVSSTGSLGTAGQINYSSTKAAMSVIPKVLTAEFFRRRLADKIRCVTIAPGYVGTAMVKNMNQKALDKILAEIPIGRDRTGRGRHPRFLTLRKVPAFLLFWVLFVVSTELISPTNPTNHGNINISLTLDLPSIPVASILFLENFVRTRLTLLFRDSLLHQLPPYW